MKFINFFYVFIFTTLTLNASWLDSLASLLPNTITLANNSQDQTFGKTHFIIGYPREQKKPKQKPQTPASDTSSITPAHVPDIFFAPDDNIRSMLIHFINNEQEAIQTAMFVFTDQQIARALIDAARRGVTVEIVTDSACLRDKNNRIGQLCANHVHVYIYDASGSRAATLSSTMHHKFVLFRKNIDNKSLVWTGSLNFTRSACEANQENALVLEEPTIINKCIQQFARLKSRSYRYGYA